MNLQRKVESETFKTENIKGLFTVLKGTAQTLGTNNFTKETNYSN